MTQSGVSQAVLALEDGMGVTLLARNREGITATEIGDQVLADAREALAAIERARQRCAGRAGLNTGTRRIGSVASAAARLLPERLRAFRSKYPGVEIALLEGTDPEVGEWVARGAV